jgi:hypothetical protein
MPLVSLFARSLVLIAGVFPVLLSPAYVDEVQAYCAKVGDDDSIKTNQLGLLRRRESFFLFFLDRFRCRGPQQHIFSMHGQQSLALQLRRKPRLWKSKSQPSIGWRYGLCKETQAKLPCPWLPRVTIHDLHFGMRGHKGPHFGADFNGRLRGFIAEKWKLLTR